MTDTRRRVKLYALNADRQWDDRGTGHVSSCYVDRVKGTSLLVRAEADGSLLLESKIQPDTAYQKQQDTLIVWSEGDNFDLALSFQEKAGCDEIWEKICMVQGKDPSVEITQDIVEESEDERCEDMLDSGPPVELPAPELSRLEDISKLIANCLMSAPRKEKLAQALESDHYIRKLLNLFHMCEDLENIEGLHHLYEIFKSIFLLNQNSLFETMFAEDVIFDVVGCLEYDPTVPQPKKHRDYLKELAKFREAIPIRNPELLAKIHQTYRVQYIQDIVLPTPSVFEENLLSALSSFIFFNKVEIVKIIEEDERFLSDLFKLLQEEKTADQKRRDLVLFLKEFCNFSQNLQPQDKDAFYKTLVSLGILPSLEITLGIDDDKTKTASIDILTYIVEFSPSVVREYTLQQANNADEDQLLLNVIIEQMLSDRDPELGGAVQLMGVLRILLDPENMLSSTNKSEKTDFLNFFYKHGVQTLIGPLLSNTCTEKLQDEYHTVQLLGLVLELLSFCVEHHTYHIKNCIFNKAAECLLEVLEYSLQSSRYIAANNVTRLSLPRLLALRSLTVLVGNQLRNSSSDLLRKILVLMRSTHTFLVLGALRFMRKIIALKDEFYNKYITRGHLFAPVIDAFIRNNGRYNLLDSAILELFEFIKLEDIKSLCSHVVEIYGKILDEVEYVQTFKALKNKYDQHQERTRDRDRGGMTAVTEGVVPSILRASRNRRDTRQLDEEEEMWFEEEEPFEGEAEPDHGHAHPHPHAHADGADADADTDALLGKHALTPAPAPTDLDSIGKLIEKKSAEALSNGPSPSPSPPRTLSLSTSPPHINPSSPLPLIGAAAAATPLPQQHHDAHLADPKLFNKGLVDYEGDSDSEEESGESGGGESQSGEVNAVPAPAASRPLTPPPERASRPPPAEEAPLPARDEPVRGSPDASRTSDSPGSESDPSETREREAKRPRLS